MERNLQTTTTNVVPHAATSNKQHDPDQNQNPTLVEAVIKEWVKQEIDPLVSKYHFYYNGMVPTSYGPKMAVVEVVKRKIEKANVSIEKIFALTSFPDGVTILLAKAEKLGVKIYNSFWVPADSEDEVN